MSDKVYMCYKTDTWHTQSSRDLFAVTDNFSDSIRLCNEKASKEGEEISFQELFNLNHMLQTQNYSGEGEFLIEVVDKNKLL